MKTLAYLLPQKAYVEQTKKKKQKYEHEPWTNEEFPNS